MKYFTKASIASLVLLSISISQVDTLFLSPQLSSIKWIGEKVTGSHEGYVSLHSGYICIKDGVVVGGEASIDMSSISCTDIENEDWNLSLVQHLKSDDFFSVEKFPISFFKINEITNMKNFYNHNNYIQGDMIIKGISNKISCPTIIEKTEKNNWICKGKLLLDRTKWDIKYKSTSYFEDLGDRAIYDDFKIDFQFITK